MLFQLILALRASLNAFFNKFYYYISLPYHYWRHNFDQGLLPQAMHNGLEPHLSKIIWINKVKCAHAVIICSFLKVSEQSLYHCLYIFKSHHDKKKRI